jgi:hypothetical protein
MESKSQDDQILAQLLAFNNSEVKKGWLEEEAGITGYPPERTRLVAKLAFPTGGNAELLDLSQSADEPTVGVVYRRPHISRGRTPAGDFMSPLELFLALKHGESPPEILRRHHDRLAQHRIFGPQPRNLPAPLWGAPDPDLPPEFGPVHLCHDGWTGFQNNWAWFSMWHGVVNLKGWREMSTGWSVLTGTSVPRSAALCMAVSAPASARAKYVILNKQNGGPWESIYSSTDWTGPGEGVGFQVYGPDEGRTRIRVNTQDNAAFVFYAGASWGTPQEWISI